MAKFESEGYCPYIWVPKTWCDSTDNRLYGLWSLVGQSIVYEKECNSDACNEVFGIDVIAYDVLSAIVKKNANADKILVHELHNGACNMQTVADIQKVLNEAINPELIVHAGSNFTIVLAEAEHGLDLWVWDLRTIW